MIVYALRAARISSNAMVSALLSEEISDGCAEHVRGFDEKVWVMKQRDGRGERARRSLLHANSTRSARADFSASSSSLSASQIERSTQ